MKTLLAREPSSSREDVTCEGALFFTKTTDIIMTLSTVNRGTAGTVAILTQQIAWLPTGILDWDYWVLNG